MKQAWVDSQISAEAIVRWHNRRNKFGKVCGRLPHAASFHSAGQGFQVVVVRQVVRRGASPSPGPSPHDRGVTRMSLGILFSSGSSSRTIPFWGLKTLFFPVSLHLKTVIKLDEAVWIVLYSRFFFFLVKGKALFSGKQRYVFDFHQEKTGPLACGSGYSIAHSCSRSMLALVESPSPGGLGWQFKPQPTACLVLALHSPTGIIGLIDPTPHLFTEAGCPSLLSS